MPSHPEENHGICHRIVTILPITTTWTLRPCGALLHLPVMVRRPSKQCHVRWLEIPQLFRWVTKRQCRLQRSKDRQTSNTFALRPAVVFGWLGPPKEIAYGDHPVGLSSRGYAYSDIHQENDDPESYYPLGSISIEQQDLVLGPYSSK